MYFGKTVQDPYKYKGSGVAWGAHIREYNATHETKIIGLFKTEKALRKAAIAFSEKYDVGYNKQLANLIPEVGGAYGGNTHRNWNDAQRKAFAKKIAKVWENRSPEHRSKIVAKGLETNPKRYNSPNAGGRLTRSAEDRSAAAKKFLSKLSKKELSDRAKNTISYMSKEELLNRSRAAAAARTPLTKAAAIKKYKITVASWTTRQRNKVRKNISQAKLGKCTYADNPNSRTTKLFGVTYHSRREASEKLGVSAYVLTRLIRDAEYRRLFKQKFRK